MTCPGQSARKLASAVTGGAPNPVKRKPVDVNKSFLVDFAVGILANRDTRKTDVQLQVDAG
jgi:hypothetical protein